MKKYLNYKNALLVSIALLVVVVFVFRKPIYRFVDSLWTTQKVVSQNKYDDLQSRYEQVVKERDSLENKKISKEELVVLIDEWYPYVYGDTEILRKYHKKFESFFWGHITTQDDWIPGTVELKPFTGSPQQNAELAWTNLLSQAQADGIDLKEFEKDWSKYRKVLRKTDYLYAKENGLKYEDLAKDPSKAYKLRLEILPAMRQMKKILSN